MSSANESPPVDLSVDTSALNVSLDEVVVLAAKRPQPLREAAASTSVITAADLEAYGWRDFTEAVASLAGIYTTNPGDNTYLGVRGVSLHGDTNGRVLILVDGHMQQELWSHSAYLEMLGLDATLIDHIEVLRGPASSLYGSLGFLAIINIVTRRGGEHDWARVTYQQRNLFEYSGAASIGHRWASGLEAGLQLRGLLSQGQSYTYSDLYTPDPSNPNGGPVDNACVSDTPQLMRQTCTRGVSTAETDAATGIAAYGHLSWQGLTIKGSYQYLDKNIPFAPYGTLFNDPANHFLTTRAYLDVGYEAGHPQSAQVTARGYYDAASYVDDLAYGPDDSHTDRWLFHDEAHPWWIGAELKLLVEREPTDSIRIAVTGGGEITWLHGDDKSGEVGTQGVFIAHDLLFGSVYGQAELTLARKLALTLGLRGDFSDVFPSEVSPRLGLVLLPWQSSTFKLLYAHGFIFPSWYDVFFNDNVSIVDNPHLGPERADNYELVWQQQIGAPLVATTSLFYIHGDQLLEQVPVCVSDPTASAAAGCPDGQSLRNQTENSASFQSWGAEVGLVGRFHNNARLYANYSFAHATSADGTHAVNSPEHMVKAGLSYPVWRDHLHLGAELRYLSSRRLIPQDVPMVGAMAQDLGSAPGYVDVAAFLVWKDLPRSLNLTLKVHDLAAQTWVDPSTAEDSHPIVRIPRGGVEAVVRLSYGF